MEPPQAKRPRLKLNFKPPEPNDSPGDTITVSRPKRQSVQKARYSEDADVSDGGASDDAVKSKPERSSTLSSRVSLPLSKPTAARQAESREEPRSKSARQDYGDLMSYYIADGNDEDEQIDKPEKMLPPQLSLQPQRRKPPSIKITIPRRSYSPSQSVGKDNRSVPRVVEPRNGIPQHPAPQQVVHRPPPPPPPPAIPQPILHFVEIAHPPKPTQPDTVASMIEKLEKLSAALTSFGGVPAEPITPHMEKKHSKPKAPIESFLALFEDDAAEDAEDEVVESLPINPGIPDESLAYGIQFIQNALKSWAQQRLHLQYSQQFQAQGSQAQQQQQSHPHPHQQKRRPGRPRKFGEDHDPAHVSQPPQTIRLDLAETPEGAAIRAFQSVLDSGCLQINVILPAELTRALRRLYMQIDRLINQGAKDEAPWKCCSYNTQILSHQIRLEKWKEAHARAQEEMVRQQHLAQQHMMAQMGLQNGRPAQWTPAQAQHAHAIELERRRSVQHAAQQPYISQQHLNPLQLGTPTPNVRAGFGPPASTNSAPSSMGPPGRLPGDRSMKASRNPADYLGALPSENQPGLTRDVMGQVQLDRMKMYMPGFLPRSGQSMKFSFTPHNDVAMRVFGADAFPADYNSQHMPEKSLAGAPRRSPLSATVSAATKSKTPAEPTKTAAPHASSRRTMIDITDDANENITLADNSSRKRKYSD